MKVVYFNPFERFLKSRVIRFALCMLAALGFPSVLFCNTPDLSIQNDFFSVSLSPKGAIICKNKNTPFAAEQESSQYGIEDIKKYADRISYKIRTPHSLINADIRITGDTSFELVLSGGGDMPEDIKYPEAWKMRKGDIGLYPMGGGYAFPVDMKDMPMFKMVYACTSHSWPMWLYGFKRGNTYVICGIEKGYDLKFLNTYKKGLMHTSPVWLSQKKRFGYDRKIRFFMGDSLANVMGQYRDWRESLGFVKTMRKKCETSPELWRLRGAANFWIWDDNATSRLYGRPKIANPAPRNVRKIAEEMLELGIDRVLWNNFEDESREDCEYLKSLGFLVGTYDIYRDVLPADIVHKIIPERVKLSAFRTKFWPDIVATDESGKMLNAWKVHGLDGNLYSQHRVCDISALELTKINVPAKIAKVPYTARLIDVQAGTPPMECYNPKHPATRSESGKYVDIQNEFLKSLGLVVGVECGHECHVAHYDYTEGMRSPAKLRNPQSGRRMTHSYERSEVSENFEKYMFNPEYRIPLWELAYHDCAVNYWYWGDSSCCCPDLMYKADLFDALYAYPPIYSLDVSHWNKLKERIAKSYKRAAAVARKAGFEKMTNFEYLTPDKKVQRTTFANGVRVTANFSDRDFPTLDGKVIAPWDYIVERQ